MADGMSLNMSTYSIIKSKSRQDRIRMMMSRSSNVSSLNHFNINSINFERWIIVQMMLSLSSRFKAVYTSSSISSSLFPTLVTDRSHCTNSGCKLYILKSIDSSFRFRCSVTFVTCPFCGAIFTNFQGITLTLSPTLTAAAPGPVTMSQFCVNL